MTDDLEMYQGDLKPDLRAVVSARSGPGQPFLPVDLTGATSVHVIGRQNGIQVFDRVGVNEGNSVVSMQWVSGDTNDVGRIHVRVRVVWPGAKPQTFPAAGAVVVHA